MKKKYIVFGLVMASFNAVAQRVDTSYSQKKLSKTDITTLFSFYTQDGQHSAVTGGEGTENLQVYSSDVMVKQQLDSSNTLQYGLGIDIISSASTDKIDFVVSSASKRDFHLYGNAHYSHLFRKTGISVGGGGSISLESDYFSKGGRLTLGHINKSQSREWGLDFQALFDDLRWGAFNPHYHGPIKLVYPIELRNQDWYDTFRRNTYSLSLSFYQTINRRMTLAVFPGITLQQGLLATPFHRVYFNDGSTLKVENLPGSRVKVPLALQLNAFLGNRVILRSYYRFYWDDFGVQAHTIQLDVPVKLTPFWTLTPFLRLYTQTASKYFKPFEGHDVSEEFYTCDYDLSAFNSVKGGLGLRYAPQKQVLRRLFFNAVNLRYSFYKRSDGLYAHVVALVMDWGVR